MKILQINMWESPGKRFHGLAITPLLAQHGIESKHLVWEKDSDHPNVLSFEGQWTHKINHLVNRLEDRFSLQSMLHLNGKKIMKMSAFREADLIHLHIIHTGYFSLADLPKLTFQKPTVWTLHDCWAITGHCNHPKNCERWKIGCGQCPDLGTTLPLRNDNTQQLFHYKRRCYEQSNFDAIVASNWMYEKIATSPLFQGITSHYIPFGIDLHLFHPAAHPDLRAKLNITPDAVIISFRAKPGSFKGLAYIIEALKHIETQQKICLLTTDNKGLLECFADRFQIVELGWIQNDDNLMAGVMAISDIFLMPSVAESFGMMAIEAMACGTPLIVFEDTSLAEISFAPEVGIAVPLGNVAALSHNIQHLINNPQERAERGRKARLFAEKHYSDALHAQRLATVYEHKIQTFNLGII
jgi:glycosyltransferase involved in cell wall biosynthesis